MVLSPIAAEHVHSPRNAGELPGATHIGVGGVPGDGPYVRLWLVVQDGRIVRASYACNGCPSSIAASSMTATLPEGKGYYADLAVEALRDALASREV